MFFWLDFNSLRRSSIGGVLKGIKKSKEIMIIQGNNLTSDGSGSKNFCGLGWVGSAIFGLGMDMVNFPQKCQIFQFFALRIKKCHRVRSKSTRIRAGSASYLLRVKRPISIFDYTIFVKPIIWKRFWLIIFFFRLFLKKVSSLWLIVHM